MTKKELVIPKKKTKMKTKKEKEMEKEKETLAQAAKMAISKTTTGPVPMEIDDDKSDVELEETKMKKKKQRIEKVKVTLEEEDPVFKTTFSVKRYRVLPDKDHKHFLLNLFGSYRKLYNEMVATATKHQEYDILGDMRDNFFTKPQSRIVILDEYFVNGSRGVFYENNAHDYVLKYVCADIRKDCAREFDKNYKTNLDKLAAGDIEHFDMGFKSRKDQSQSVYIRADWIKNSSVNIQLMDGLGLKPICLSRRIPPEDLNSDCRLVRLRTGKYELVVTTEVKGYQRSKANLAFGAPLDPDYLARHPNVTADIARMQASGLKPAAIDPGVRTPVTVYDPSREQVLRIADDKRFKFMDAQMANLDQKINTKTKQKNSLKGKARRKAKNAVKRMRKAALRMRERGRNLRDDMHYQTASFLTKNYDIIFLPKFEASNMTKKTKDNGDKRTIGPKTTKSMLDWSHNLFRQRLISKCERTGIQLVLCQEQYSTQTCGRCFRRNANVGASEIYSCVDPLCGYWADRDGNAARIICLMTAHPVGIHPRQ